PVPQRLLHKALRLCEQAYQQGGLLSNCDIAELLSINDTRISEVLAAHERETNTVVPRRATLHDVGSGLTHNRIICSMRYAEGKESRRIAREAAHSFVEADGGLGEYDGVRDCRLQGLARAETSDALGCSLALVNEFLAIRVLLEVPRARAELAPM